MLESNKSNNKLITLSDLSYFGDINSISSSKWNCDKYN